MQYCVIKNTITIIDGSNNSEEVMLKNAENAGYTNEQFEILTEEEFKDRVDSLPKEAQQPTADEILRAKLIKDNASIQLQLTQQQKLNADILLKIANLGGATNA